jgi:multidrug efflux system outer membrane protein
MMRKKLLVSLALLALPGCATMAPKYVRPAPPVSPGWPAGAEYGTGGAKPPGVAAADLAWRDFFTNDSLRKVIDLALSNNRDLRVATLNIERTQAQYRIRQAELLPTVAASGGGSVQRIPETLSGVGESVTRRQYDAGLGITGYELDLFGRVQSLKTRALENYLASEQGRRSVQIALVSEVAGRWLALAADRERLHLAGETLRGQENAYELTKRRFESGVAPELDLRQARTLVEAARFDIARYTAVVAQDRNALDQLAGTPVPDGLLPAALDAVTTMEELSPGIPSDLLQRRPDIIEVEGALKGANANIGAARAAFFPRITLTTSVGLGSDELTALFKGGAAAWNFALRISIPIFEGGVNRANLRVAEIDREIFLAQYEKTIQGAFREVADALAQRGTIGDQLAAQQSLVEAAAAIRKLSGARYEKGVDSYLAVLDAQRSLYAAQQNLIAARLARLANQVTLYKALGGGA